MSNLITADDVIATQPFWPPEYVRGRMPRAMTARELFDATTHPADGTMALHVGIAWILFRVLGARHLPTLRYWLEHLGREVTTWVQVYRDSGAAANAQRALMLMDSDMGVMRMYCRQCARRPDLQSSAIGAAYRAHQNMVQATLCGDLVRARTWVREWLGGLADLVDVCATPRMVTAEDLIALGPCETWPDARVRAEFPEPTTAHAIVARELIPFPDRVWAVCNLFARGPRSDVAAMARVLEDVAARHAMPRMALAMISMMTRGSGYAPADLACEVFAIFEANGWWPIDTLYELANAYDAEVRP